MSAKPSSGLDGVQVSHPRSCDPVCPAKAFKCFLLARHIPQPLKDCRTTLIPKTDDPRPDAEDYRPITIASCVYRLFSKIVTRRFLYPGPFKCHACEHLEAVYARIVNHSTHHNVVVDGLTCTKCSKHFLTINAVASHYARCKKVVNREPSPATVTPPIGENESTTHAMHVCIACSHTFTTLSGLRLHERRKHAANFAASSQKHKNHRWSEAALHEVREAVAKLGDAGISSLSALARELSRLWQEDISVNTAKYLRRRARQVEPSADDSHEAPACTIAKDCVAPELENLTEGSQNTTSERGISVKQTRESLTPNTRMSLESRKHYTDGVASVLTTLLRPNNDGRHPPVPTNQRKRRPQPPASNRRARNRHEYAKLQSLFKRDPKRIAAQLIKNQPLCNVSCPIDVAESALRQRLSQRPEPDAAPYIAKRLPDSANILSPISADEVTLHLKLMSAKTSSGLDGVQVSHLRNCDPDCRTTLVAMVPEHQRCFYRVR
ncbi:hypothetical protein T4A_69 [Trichinella pseudospiralis]|uniref:C2H2-type domain-containing protein n=1 Tax=Trichinella pseudospiralis TaxID=6337 RepID=A0A0V1DUH2_TRIPS|nr:hypothetical protein T4A_69 [Trichinella pseudospiralis]